MSFFNETLPTRVPEYFRAQTEEDRQFDMAIHRRACYLANQQKLDAARQSGLPVLDFGGYDACHDCPDADHDTVTDDEDDICRVICHNPACQCHQTNQGG